MAQHIYLLQHSSSSVLFHHSIPKIPLLHPSLTPSSPLSVKPLSLDHRPIQFPYRIFNRPSLKPLNCTRLHSLPPSPHPLESFSELKPYLRSQSGRVLAGWLCSLVSVVSLSRIVAGVGSFTADVNGLSGYDNVAKLRDGGLVLGALVLVRLVATYFQQALLWEAALRAVYEIRVFVFEKVLERELGFFEGGNGASPGDIAYRITAEAADVADTVFALLNTIVPSMLQLSAMAAQMVAISPLLSSITVVVIPCMALVVIYLGESLRRISNKAHLSIAALSAYLNEVFPAVLFVKANNAESCEKVRFQRLALADLSEHLNKKRMKALIPQIIQFIYFGSLLMLCGGSLIFCRGSIDACSMVSFVTSLIFLIDPIQGVGKAYNELKQGEPAIVRLFNLTKTKSKVAEKPNTIELENVTGEVKFSDISFRYGEDMPLVLDGFNLHIKAGETVALVGPSGGGKTTLAKLLLRLYDPLSGAVLIDNHNVQNIKLESLRRHVGLVSQNIVSASCFPPRSLILAGKLFTQILFSGTVAENIGYKDLMAEIDMRRVELAAQIANADEFIKTLPEGYRTEVGPGGSSLSGGQRQRLAIARALYRNSSILILDEATSALDSRSELLVRQALEQLMKNHTVLVIAHRLETVLMANRVFLLDDGKLKELPRSTLLATHQEMLVSSGLVI